MIKQLWRIEIACQGDFEEWLPENCLVEFEQGSIVFTFCSKPQIRMNIHDLRELLTNYDPNYHD